VFLAGTAAHAPLALDLALSADVPTLAAWAEQVAAATGQGLAAAVPEDALDRPDLGWLLERTALALLAGRLDRGQQSAADRGMLTRHTGEVGMFPGALANILDRVESDEQFRAAVVNENLAFLESADPATRVRAYDWLRGRGVEPPAYDPLADRRARRDALEAFHAGTGAGETANADPGEGTR
jgi:hypothetical protein